MRPLYPERVLAADAGTVTLAASRLAAQPGTWGLRWAGGLAVVGPVTRCSRAGWSVRCSAAPVPPAGHRAVIDAGPYDPDPAARGLAFADVEVPTPLGPCPAWHVPGATATRGS